MDFSCLKGEWELEETKTEYVRELMNKRLLKSVDVDDDGDVGRSLTRFLRYHPINEFEPFFESIGLRVSDYASFLPRNLMFLNDDQLLLDNYYVLCNYGVPRNMIGKVYIEAMDVFRYGYGVLQLKLQCFKNLGLKQSLVVKIITSSPYLLRGDVSHDFIEFLEKLKIVGIEYDWLEEHISNEDSYNWKCMFELMCLLGEFGLDADKLGEVIRKHPDVLLECSGRVTVRFVGFLLKFGSTLSDDDPFVLKNWIPGVRADRPPEPNRVLKVRMMKTKFLLGLGFVENSDEIERALKVFRGKGMELQERFDCLVKTGLSREDVITMLKVSPQILNQSKDVIKTKIVFFVDHLGYPVSDLVTHPAIVSYTIQRVKLRLLTYKWLKDEGVVHPRLALSTLLSCSEEIFVRSYVNAHPRGPEFWERLKKKIYSD
ncbi:hypothetical protein DH2020_013896 [Rehmannia glutinosa]|uniref:Uncharacterized protein n=1 Tax=Rehmannia glutinosa TaxID=99300 RepID=A0ABR0WXC4_REHGL